MKQLTLNNEFSNVDYLNSLIDDFIIELKTDRLKNHQKILELCHAAKFLSFFNNKYHIEKISEEPDFIISSANERIGLEHQILIESISKEKEGFCDNLFRLAEQILTEEKSTKNFLANIYINPFFDIKINEKQKSILEIVETVNIFAETGELIENELIERISIMPHSRISLCPNLGAWWQKNISPDLLIKAINKKERLIDNYVKKTNLNQWLLIVIGGLGESSYQLDNNFNLDVESKFDKIYILEDFNYQLYEIK